MPRGLRQKDKNQPHHIISKSIDEINLFRNNQDKEDYIELIKHSAAIHRVEVLAYVLMDNHVHLLVHLRGGDISEFMRNINNPYAKNHNQKYGRSGHLFKGRFKNIIIKDLPHLLRTSTYIHNNPKDLLYQGYKTVGDYPYSSIKDYISPGRGCNIANPSFIFKQMGGNYKLVHQNYIALMQIQLQDHDAFTKEIEEAFRNRGYETDKETFERNENADKVISVLQKLMNMNDEHILHTKYVRKYREFKGIVVIAIRIFCDISLSQMTKYFKGHTSATLSNLSKVGLKVFEDRPELFKQIRNEL